MIVYVVSQYLAPSHTFIRREVAALRRRGVKILPVSVRHESASADCDVLTILGAPMYRILARAVATCVRAPRGSIRTWALAQRHRSDGIRGWIWAQFHLVEALALVAALRRVDVKRIHSHFANSGATVGMLAAHQLRVPWSLMLHGISELDPPAGALLAAKIERADFVACASWFIRAQGMRTVPPRHWPKFHLVRCGVELDRIGARRARARPSGLRFVTVGRLSAEKGYPGLLTAFARLVQSAEAELVIVGDGPLRAELEQEIEDRGLTSRISLRGALPEAEALAEIGSSDVFVLPSLMEGLPVVLVEAMALSKPVIAACVAGIPELIRDGETGLLFRPGDWDHLAEKMLLLAEDAQLRARVAGRARPSIEREYDIDAAVEPLVKLLGPAR
jgi:glycosyltransferase involved in cell wall biosynthesis